MKKNLSIMLLACMAICTYAQNNNTEWWENIQEDNVKPNVQTDTQKQINIDFSEYLTVFGGMGLSNFTGDDSKHMSNSPGLNIGLSYGGMIGNWGLEVGMFYNKTCTEYDYNGKSDISMNFIEVNYLVGYSPYNKNSNTLLFNAGLGYNIGVTAPMKAKDGTYLVIGDGNKVDLFGDKNYDGLYDSNTLTLILGATFRSKIGLTGRVLYHIGTRDLSKGDYAPSFYLNYWEFSLGYAFKL